MKCLFCAITNKEIPAKIEYEDERVVVFHDINPQAPTHLLAIPRLHIESLRDVTDEHTDLLGYLLKISAQVARALGHDENGYRVVINTGSYAGQTVFHVHAHVLGGRVLSWPPG